MLQRKTDEEERENKKDCWVAKKNILMDESKMDFLKCGQCFKFDRGGVLKFFFFIGEDACL